MLPAFIKDHFGKRSPVKKTRQSQSQCQLSLYDSSAGSDYTLKNFSVSKPGHDEDLSDSPKESVSKRIRSVKALFPDDLRTMENNNNKYEATWNANLFVSVVSNEQITCWESLYAAAEAIIDEYVGPTYSKPIFITCFAGALKNMTRVESNYLQEVYETKYIGPLNILYEREAPLDCPRMNVDIKFESTMSSSYYRFTYKMSFSKTKRIGAPLEMMFEGNETKTVCGPRDMLCLFGVRTYPSDDGSRWGVKLSS